jgi:hypothetical protein
VNGGQRRAANLHEILCFAFQEDAVDALELVAELDLRTVEDRSASSNLLDGWIELRSFGILCLEPDKLRMEWRSESGVCDVCKKVVWCGIWRVSTVSVCMCVEVCGMIDTDGGARWGRGARVGERGWYG